MNLYICNRKEADCPATCPHQAPHRAIYGRYAAPQTGAHCFDAESICAMKDSPVICIPTIAQEDPARILPWYGKTFRGFSMVWKRFLAWRQRRAFAHKYYNYRNLARLLEHNSSAKNEPPEHCAEGMKRGFRGPSC